MDNFYPPWDAIPHSLTQLWTQFAGVCYRPSVWVYTNRLEALPSMVWGRFMYLRRQWHRDGEVDEKLESLVLLVNVFKCNEFPTIEMSAIHILLFFDTYPGRIERDSAPISRNWRASIHYLIVAPIPASKQLLHVHWCPTKEATYWDPNCRSSASIALIGSQERNSKSCIDTPSGFFRAIEPYWSRRHEFGRISNLDFWTDVDVLRLLCTRTQTHGHAIARQHHKINLSHRQ